MANEPSDDDDDDLTPYLAKPKALDFLKQEFEKWITEKTNLTQEPGSPHSGNYLEKQNEMLLAELLKLKGLSIPGNISDPQKPQPASLENAPKPPLENGPNAVKPNRFWK